MGALGGLGLLAPIGETLQGQFQAGAERQQQATNREAFGKALEQLGPEYEFVRQMHRAGASPDAILGVLQTPIGEDIQKEYKARQWQDFVGPGGISNMTPDKIWQGVGRNIFSIDEAFKYQEDWNKNQLEMAKLQRQQMLKTDPKFNTFLAMKGITTEDQLQQLQQDPKAMEALRPEYEKFAGLGANSTKLQRVYHPETGMETLEYVPKSGPEGKVIGYTRPPAGGNPIAVLHSAEMGMHRAQDLLKALANPDGTYSNLPMKPTAELMKLGIKPSDNYAHLQLQLGQIYSTLNTMIMRAGGFRNPAMAAEWMGNHVPKPTDSPAQVADKIQQWFTPGGLLDDYRQALGENVLVMPTEAGLKGLGIDPLVAGGAGGTPPTDLEDISP